jgi:AcrR family transcriptional regulator
MTDRQLTRKERQARTRSRLLHSASTVFARRGLQHASIDDVAADAGFTKGAFYANFSSKEELFLAMLEDRFAERLEQIQQLSFTESDVEQQIRAAGEQFAQYLTGDPDWQRLFFEFAVHAARADDFRIELVSRYSDLRAGIADVLARRAAELELSLPVEVEQLAMMIFAMANGFSLERLLEPEAASQELYGVMLTIFFAGLRTLAQEAEQSSRKGI